MMPLVLVHGFMGGSEQWHHQITGLTNDFDLITIDLPGFGNKTSLPALGTITEYADWVLTHLSERGIDRFHLLGHSMGGMIVQQMAAYAPTRIDNLVLYSTGAIGMLPGRFETIEESKQRLQMEGSHAIARRTVASWFRDYEQADEYEACAAIATQSSSQAIIAGLEAMQSWTGESLLPDIPCRTLVLWGDLDRTYTWAQTERLWRNIPQANLAVIPQCAHAVHLEKPNLFNQVITTFLRS